MTGTYNIYCDESTHLENDHQPFMLFGYVQIAYNELRIAKEQIKEIRRKYNYTDEFKWTNIHESTFKVYDELIEYFFSSNMDDHYNVYLDIKDTCSQDKLRKLRDILRYNNSIRTCNFVRSHQVIFVQLADVMMGAINYKLRMEKGTLDGKVLAKRRILEKIERLSRQDLMNTSYLSDRKFNLFFIKLKKLEGTCH